MPVKDKLYLRILIICMAFLSIGAMQAQEEVVVRPKNRPKAMPLPIPENYENRPLSPEEKYKLALARHLALQDEKTRMRILNDIKMTNNYYDKRKESKFVKWLKWQKFKLKRKGIL